MEASNFTVAVNFIRTGREKCSDKEGGRVSSRFHLKHLLLYKLSLNYSSCFTASDDTACNSSRDVQ